MNVPTRRFGRTELQMPVLSLGAMRCMQSWKTLNPNEIERQSQKHLEETVCYGLEHGINHIETARGYGSSEMQLGTLFTRMERDALLVQTKIYPWDDPNGRLMPLFEESMGYLKLDYVDLLAVHGVNTASMLTEVLKKGGALDEAKQLKKEGRARFIGLSTHAEPETVIRAIETGEFDFVNLHWYYIYHPMHWSMIEAAQKADMGVFIISPNDKGGKLYEPPQKLVDLCAPLTPMQWNALFTLRPPAVHTISIGASKPSDFDEHIEAVTRWWGQNELVEAIEDKLQTELESVLGADWMENWTKGLPHFSEVPHEINVREILRMWTFYKGLDMLAFAKMRYNTLGNASHWLPGKQASNLAGIDWSCLKQSPFSDQIPEILAQAHRTFVDVPQERLSKSED